jgi:hypothetical protein
MHRSSETIGTVAGALARAQAELTNPEKSLVATIRTEGPGRGVERSFRYARRYALFTLVGIAGKDDIDAPDLSPAPAPTAPSGPGQAAPNGDKRLNGGPPRSAPRQTRNSGERGPRIDLRPSPTLLDHKASSALRDRLAADLKGIGSAAEAAAWALSGARRKGHLGRGRRRTHRGGFPAKAYGV